MGSKTFCFVVACPIAILVAGGTACSSSDSGGPGGNPDGGTEGSTTEGGGPPAATIFSRSSHGSAIDISEDDAIVVAANHDVGTITVFDAAYPAGAPPTLTKRAEVQVCNEPSQVLLAPGGDKAFVLCRVDQKLVRVDGLRSTPTKGSEAQVGSEPTGLALTPKATYAWVANWADGTLSQVETATMTVKTTVDLNPALVATGALGTVTARPALAHPRAIAITNNNSGLEGGESLFVTEFFAQQKEALAANGSNADVSRQGMVYRVSLADNSVNVIKLPPIADIGIHDHTDGVAGCYPNQVVGMNIQGSFAYALSVCASPKGPIGVFTGPAFTACTLDSECPGAAVGSCNTGVAPSVCTTNCTGDAQCGLGGKCNANLCAPNFADSKTLQTPAVQVIDIGSSEVVASVALNKEFTALFNAGNVADNSDRRFPLNITDVGFVPSTLIGYFTAKGSDAVYRVDFNATYQTKAIDSVGSPGHPFIQFDRGTLDVAKQGKLPVAIAIAHDAKLNTGKRRYGFVLNDATRNVTVLDLNTDDIAGLPDNAVVTSSAPMPTAPADQAVLEGRRLFSTGLGRWSFNGQAWGACETCHWDGLSDQVTWFHLRGPRQTPSIDQAVNKKTGALRIENWQANVDELEDHEAGALRSILGGIGADVRNTDLTYASRIAFDKNGHGGLNGSMKAAVDPASSSTLVTEVNVLSDWVKIAAYEKTVRSPRKPSNLDAAQVTAGQTLFQGAKCQGCHGGDNWTISHVFYQPDANTTSPTNVNKMLKTKSWGAAVTGAGFPVALLPTTDVPSQMMRYAGTNAAALDQLTCMLRKVGTYNVAEQGVGIAEVRGGNMTAAAQGNENTGAGFNVPSLIGMSVGAPFFHAGNARTLEALLSDPFSAHHGAFDATFLGAADAQAATKRAALVQFLLSIDTTTPAVAIPALGADGGDFCAYP